MKYWLQRGAAFLAIAAACGTASAVDLLGDTLSFMRAYPSTATLYGQPISDTTVAVGTSDQVSWKFFSNGASLLFINPEPDRIIFSFPVSFVTGGGGGVFDGIVITGFDNDIASVSVVNNTAGGSVTVGGTAREITLNLNGVFEPNQSFDVAISVVPEPATVTLMILGMGLVMLRLWRPAATRQLSP